jgi:hypothetical protein
MYAPGPPLLRVLTPIAEGADRLGATAAIEVGFELDCILPFERTQFALDFESEASRTEYESLLGKARAVLELDGSRESERSMGAAYAAASEHVLGQSDVLITLWTGAEPKGPGGTGLTVDAALAAHMPVVWINANDPRRVQIPDDEGGRSSRRTASGSSCCGCWRRAAARANRRGSTAWAGRRTSGSDRPGWRR